VRFVVVGGTGTVGSRVAQALRDRGAAVRVLTRSPEKARAMPAGVEAVVADLRQPSTLVAAFAGASGAFMATPLSPTETQEGLAAVAAAAAGGVERFVYMSAAGIDAYPHIPHFASKAPIEQAVRAAGMRYTLLRPNDFFQNDLRYQSPIVQHGLYPQPVGAVGVSRVDVRDIADAAATALTERGHEGRTYTLGGPDELTGDEIARVYRRHLRQPVRYAGDDLDAWSAQARTALPEWLVENLRIMYEHMCKHGMLATDAELAAARRLIGHGLRTFEEFVAEVASGWRS